MALCVQYRQVYQTNLKILTHAAGVFSPKLRYGWGGGVSTDVANDFDMKF